MTLTWRKRAAGQPCDYRVALRGLALAVVEGAAQEVGAGPADHVHAVPELGRAHLVRHVLERARDAAVLDLLEHLPAELRVVALLVDGERAVAVDEDAVLDPRHQLLHGHVALRVGQQVHVGHALELHVAPALRVAVAVAAHGLALRRVPLGQPGRLLARGLQVVQDAVLHDQVLVGPHALVVPADGRTGRPGCCARPGCS